MCTRAPTANPPKSAQLGASPTTPPSYTWARASVGMRTRTDRHTDVGDHNTFCVVYDSREM